MVPPPTERNGNDPADSVIERHQRHERVFRDPVDGKLGPMLADVTSYLSIVDQYDDFAKGVIDTSHLIYYGSFMTFGLFLTAKSVASDRWRG